MTVTTHVILQLWLSITFFAIKFSEVSSASYCPKQCECLGNAISCENQDFKNIPWKNFPEWMESLSLRQIAGFGHLSTSAVQSLARLDGLKHLNITSCRGKPVLDGKWLQYLPALEVLKISQCDLTETPVFHPPHPNLKSLILNRNVIKEVRVATFDSLPNLTRLELNFNRLPELRTKWFRRGHPLESLSANGNLIRRLDLDLNATLTSLRELRLNRNFLCRLSSRNFRRGKASGPDKLPLSSERLSIRLPLGGGRRIRKRRTKPAVQQQCAPESVELPAMPTVHTLELSRNSISHIDTLTFKLWKSLKVLRLKRNRLNQFGLMAGAFFIAHGGLTTLDLTANKKLSVLRPTWLYVNGQSSMRELILSKCGLLNSIDPELFNHHSELRRLDLSSNKLTLIQFAQFAKLNKLEELNLAGNRLKALPAGVFNGLKRLRKLSLADNKLTSLTPQQSSFPRSVSTTPTGLFSPLSSLQLLNLARNRLTSIQKDCLTGLTNLVQLDVRRNNLTRFSPPSVAWPHFRQLLLDSPRFTCDCALSPLLLWLQRLPVESLLAVSANCSRPAALSGKALRSVRAAQLGRCEVRATLEPRVILQSNTSVSMLRSGNETLRCEVVVSGIPASWTREQRRSLRPQVVWERVDEQGRRQQLLGSAFQPGKAHFRRLDLVALRVGTSAARWLSLLQIRPGLSGVGSLGDFQCLAKNEHGHASSPLVKVNVYQMPHFTDSPAKLISAIAGNTVPIPCSAVGFPAPVSALRKSGGIEFPAARDRRLNIFEGDVHFLIANVQRKDAGDYLCESSNAAGRIQEPFKLEVNEIPDFDKRSPPRSKVEFTVGQSAVLSCKATGWPFPGITWTKNGIPLHLHAAVEPPLPDQDRSNWTTPKPRRRPSTVAPGSGLQRTDLQLTDRGQMLVFESVQPSDAGEYGCTLLNVVGRKRAFIVMDVRSTAGLLYPGARGTKKRGGSGSREGGRRLSRHLTGIVVIAVVVCVVATSLAWVGALYCARWRKRAAAAAANAGGGPGGDHASGKVVAGRRPLLHASNSWSGPNIFVTSRALEDELVDPATAAAARLLLEKHRLLRRDATRAYEVEEVEGRPPNQTDHAPTSDYNTGTSSECSAHSLCGPGPSLAGLERPTAATGLRPMSTSSPMLHRQPEPYLAPFSTFGVHREADEYV